MLLFPIGGVSPLLGLEPVLFRERVHRLTVYTFFEGTSSAAGQGCGLGVPALVRPSVGASSFPLPLSLGHAAGNGSVPLRATPRLGDGVPAEARSVATGPRPAGSIGSHPRPRWAVWISAHGLGQPLRVGRRCMGIQAARRHHGRCVRGRQRGRRGVDTGLGRCAGTRPLRLAFRTTTPVAA